MAPAAVRRTPYKDLLQPALHRRFSTTATILLAFAYVEAILLASWNSFLWSWFPIGPAGVRTLFLSTCSLSIIVLRIAQYHVGLRTSDSAFQAFARHSVKLQTLEAIVTYVFSGWLFSQIYLWSQSKEAGLGWISYYNGDRARLNEKPLFFTYHFIIFGVAQALVHLFKDNDRLSLGVVKPRPRAEAGEAPAVDSVTHFKRFMDEMPVVLIAAGTQSLAAVLLSIFVYPIFLRGSVWRAAMLMLRPFYNLPKTNMLPSHLPFNVWLLWRCVIASFMLSFMWLAGNTAFSIFLVREPVKNGKPLTNESKDPNGSLLNGLKNRKLSIRCFAMWELAFISRDFEARRKAIYEDIDRKDGPTWSQVYAICMDVVKSIEERVDFYGKPPAPATVAAPASNDEKRRSTPPLKQDPILQSTPQKKSFVTEVEKVITQVTMSPGQTSQLSPMANKALANVKGKLLQLQRDATGSDDPQSLVKNTALAILNSPLGWPFRQEANRRLAAAVLGMPYGEPSLYINAIVSLSQLAGHSLIEDKYGNVQRDVASILRTFTSTATKLNKFRSNFPPHWTDVTIRKETPEVDAILEALRGALSQLIQDFGPYARDLRLSLTDMRLAREAAGVVEDEQAVQAQAAEMREIR